MAKLLLDKLRQTLGTALVDTRSQAGNEMAWIERAELKPAMRLLRQDSACDMDMLTDLTCVDYLTYPAPRSGPRFEMVYQLYSVGKKHRLRVKVPIPDEPEPQVVSMIDLWPAANWLEREVWDLYGIRFVGHPDLRRILLYEQFVGHPLRKDYPKEKRQPLVRRNRPQP